MTRYKIYLLNWIKELLSSKLFHFFGITFPLQVRIRLFQKQYLLDN